MGLPIIDGSSPAPQIGGTELRRQDENQAQLALVEDRRHRSSGNRSHDGPLLVGELDDFGLTVYTATLESQAWLTPSFQLERPPATPTAGQPVRLTITPAENTAPQVRVAWGDGTEQEIGAVAAARSVTHTYATPGFFTITATGSQGGDTFSNSVPVTVSQQPPVQLTVNPTTGTLGTTFTFTIEPTLGALIQNIRIEY